MGDSEWHKFVYDGPPLPSQPRKKLRLYADEHVPKPIVDEFRAVGIPVAFVAEEHDRRGHPDPNVHQRARKLKRVLLTFDKGFWSDSAYPLHTTGGVIVVDVPPDHLNRAADALIHFYLLFAKYYPLDWWPRTKARVSEYQFTIKLLSWEGRVAETQYKRVNGELYERELR